MMTLGSSWLQAAQHNYECETVLVIPPAVNRHLALESQCKCSS